jgi:hypothetical protein
MLSVVMLSVIMLSGIILNVAAPKVTLKKLKFFKQNENRGGHY